MGAIAVNRAPESATSSYCEVEIHPNTSIRTCADPAPWVSSRHGPRSVGSDAEDREVRHGLAGSEVDEGAIAAAGTGRIDREESVEGRADDGDVRHHGQHVGGIGGNAALTEDVDVERRRPERSSA